MGPKAGKKGKNSQKMAGAKFKMPKSKSQATQGMYAHI
jgi:hypothetical protein